MKIIIKSIEAELIDTSTPEENSYLISRWLVKYEVKFPPRQFTHVEGVIEVSNIETNLIPNDLIQKIFDIYKDIEAKL